MARDSLLPVRRAALTLLKSDVDLVALVPAAQIYPQSPPASPTWPFIRYGVPNALPIRGSCLDGAEIEFALHGFTKGTDDASAEDRGALIGAAIAAALDGRSVPLAVGRVALRWTGTQLLQDRDEAGAYHAVVNIRARVMS
jgi:hypothetical protein